MAEIFIASRNPFPLLLAEEVNKHQLHKMVMLIEVSQEIREKTKNV